jgi:oligosaccharyltransferase complex subunit beta
MIGAMPYHVPLQGTVGGKRTLVLLDDVNSLSTYSIFLDGLKAHGHIISVWSETSSSNLVLKKYDEYLYDNIFIMAPEAEAFSDVSFADILEFINAGKNVMLAASGDMSDIQRSFAEACGVRFDGKESLVLDHFAFEPSVDPDNLHDVIKSTSFIKNRAVLGGFIDTEGSKPEASVLYRGLGHALRSDNELAVPILRGNPSTYSKDAGKKTPIVATGTGVRLVTGMQGRNNARMLFSGSLDLFSNEFARVPGAGNAAFVLSAAFWAVGATGVIRFRDIYHSEVDGTPPDLILHEKERPNLPTTLYPDPEITRNSLVYRIKDEIRYSMIIEEARSDGSWAPYVADDVQMEFVMLDPYVRKTMTPDPATGRFSVDFTAPDDYGIFKFRVMYRRMGYSALHAETKVSLRPFKHNEYERFILTAFPYYGSAFSVMIAFFLFSVAYLFTSDADSHLFKQASDNKKKKA